MHSTYILYNIVPPAFLILLVYIFIDILLDYFRKENKSNQKRVILYSFIFYFISLIQIKFGGFTLHQNPADTSRRFISTNDWFGLFETLSSKLSRGSASAMFYNVLLFVPLGVFLILLFHVKSKKIAISLVILSCFVIDIARFFLGWTGFAMNSFSYSAIVYLFFNILGGAFGILLVNYAIAIVRPGTSTRKSVYDVY